MLERERESYHAVEEEEKANRAKPPAGGLHHRV